MLNIFHFRNLIANYTINKTPTMRKDYRDKFRELINFVKSIKISKGSRWSEKMSKANEELSEQKKNLSK